MNVSITDDGKVLVRGDNHLHYINDDSKVYYFAHKDQRIRKIDLIRFGKGFAVSFQIEGKYHMHIIDFDLKVIRILLNAKAMFEDKGNLIYANFQHKKFYAYEGKYLPLTYEKRIVNFAFLSCSYTLPDFYKYYIFKYNAKLDDVFEVKEDSEGYTQLFCDTCSTKDENIKLNKSEGKLRTYLTNGKLLYLDHYSYKIVYDGVEHVFSDENIFLAEAVKQISSVETIIANKNSYFVFDLRNVYPVLKVNHSKDIHFKFICIDTIQK